MTTELRRITAQEAMEILKGLNFKNFRTDTVLVECASKDEEAGVKSAAAAHLGRNVRMVGAANLHRECEVLISFQQPTVR